MILFPQDYKTEIIQHPQQSQVNLKKTNLTNFRVINATYKLYLTKVTDKVKQALILKEKLTRRNFYRKTPYSNLLAVAFN